MSTLQRALLALGLAGWIGLGLAHVTIVMTGAKGWRPDRSAPGAASVVGHPHDTDPRMVGGPLELARAAPVPVDRPLLLVLPAATDSGDVLYARYQLAHLLYPRRVMVRREGHAAEPTGAFLLIAHEEASTPQHCRAAASSLGYSLLECAAR